MTCY